MGPELLSPPLLCAQTLEIRDEEYLVEKTSDQIISDPHLSHMVWLPNIQLKTERCETEHEID